jgi:hypothetical protein
LELDTANLQKNLTVKNLTTGISVQVECDLSDLDRATVLTGGKLAAIKKKHASAS